MHKEIRNTLAYIAVATFVMITAVWQAQVSAARDLEARHRNLPPPPKTKHAIRPAPQPFTGNPVSNYNARRAKGLTEQEIGWILADFRNSGLESPPGAAPVGAYLGYRQAQHRWYRDALVDGLQLTPEQSAQVSAKLAELYQAAEKTYLAMINALKPVTGSDGKQYLIAGADTFNSVISATAWLESADGSFAPWNLCTLGPEQQKIIRKDHGDSSPQTKGPLSDSENRDTRPGADVPSEYRALESIFPLPGTADPELFQDSLGDTEALEMAIRSLHPAQLKIFLLFNPSMAAKIETGL